MRRPKFHLTEGIIRDVLAEINRFGIYVDAPELVIELPDPKDRVFYEVVMKERKKEDAYLITGNIRHFPEKPYVITPRQMLDIMVGNMDE